MGLTVVVVVFVSAVVVRIDIFSTGSDRPRDSFRRYEVLKFGKIDELEEDIALRFICRNCSQLLKPYKKKKNESTPYV